MSDLHTRARTPRAVGTETVGFAKEANRSVREETNRLAGHVLFLRSLVAPADQEPINRIIDNTHELVRVSWVIEAQLCQRIEHLMALPEEDK
jgi:hypothetical protein